MHYMIRSNYQCTMKQWILLKLATGVKEKEALIDLGGICFHV
jgi:hypothetical protein